MLYHLYLFYSLPLRVTQSDSDNGITCHTRDGASHRHPARISQQYIPSLVPSMQYPHLNRHLKF